MNYRHQQSGIVLLQALVFLLILTVLGLSAARKANLEQQIAGNLQTTAMEFQKAENCIAERLVSSIPEICGPEEPPQCDELSDIQAKNEECCLLGSIPQPDNSSVGSGLLERYYEINSNACGGDNNNVPTHRVGVAIIQR